LKNRIFQHPVRARLPLLGLFLAAALAALALSLATGSVSIPFPELWRLLWHDDGSVHARILHELRLPRALSAFSIGALLGTAGVLMQVLRRNPCLLYTPAAAHTPPCVDFGGRGILKKKTTH